MGHSVYKHCFKCSYRLVVFHFVLVDFLLVDEAATRNQRANSSTRLVHSYDILDQLL